MKRSGPSVESVTSTGVGHVSATGASTIASTSWESGLTAASGVPLMSSPQAANRREESVRRRFIILEPCLVARRDHSWRVWTRPVRATRNDDLLVEDVAARDVQLGPLLDPSVSIEIDRQQRR